MTPRRPFEPLRRSVASFVAALLVVPAVIAACAPAAPRTVAITSHADGERIVGTRTITIAGTATNVDEIQVLVDGTVVATVAVASGAFAADVALGANDNAIRAQTTDAVVGDDVALVYPWVDLTTFRPADLVLGQVDMASNTNGTSATELGPEAYGTPVYVGGILYVPDPNNNRILGYFGFPDANGAAADFVLGQATFSAASHNDDDQDGIADAKPSDRTFWCPSEVASDGVRLVVADACNERILIYDALPTTDFAAADVVVGQATMTENGHTPCSLAQPFSHAERLAVGGGMLVVPEYEGNRVLIWTSLPTTNGTEPDLVLGQPATAATCAANDDDQNGVAGDPTARTLFAPWDAWTDGDRLLVTDFGNHRVLLWQTFPTDDFAPADVVIGQATMTTGTPGAGATGLEDPYTVSSNGNQILVEEYYRSRAVVFDAFPTVNGVAAKAVLGQSDFANVAANDDDQDGVSDANPTARTLAGSYGSWMGEGVLILNDSANTRYLLFVD